MYTLYTILAYMFQHNCRAEQQHFWVNFETFHTWNNIPVIHLDRAQFCIFVHLLKSPPAFQGDKIGLICHFLISLHNALFVKNTMTQHLPPEEDEKQTCCARIVLSSPPRGAREPSSPSLITTCIISSWEMDRVSSN